MDLILIFLKNLLFVKCVLMVTSIAPRASGPLKLVHSDLCGKMNVQSESTAEYFLFFIDDRTRYVWVYILHCKDQVFEKFREWKAMVEN